MTTPHTAVFCDFDGTIARRDVGYNLFKHFSGGRTRELLPDWKAGRMTSREILVREAAMAPCTEADLLEFLKDFDLDPGFQGFAERCRSQNLELYIVSDGLDLYINRLLERYRLTHLPLITNHGYFNGSYIHIEFPHTNRNCMRCGSCKGERIREYREKQDGPSRIIFVGDGLSDACAAHEADLLFAKKDLERYCHMHNIACTSFADFFDVARTLETLGVLA